MTQNAPPISLGVVTVIPLALAAKLSRDSSTNVPGVLESNAQISALPAACSWRRSDVLDSGRWKSWTLTSLEEAIPRTPAPYARRAA